MNLIDRIKSWFGGKKPEKQEPAPEPTKPERIKKKCKKCGKTFSVDPSWQFVPNYCKECKQSFAREKEQRQRAGAPRQIKRTCKNCGKFFTFPSTLPHYPSYCTNCRKRHQAEMKEKYGRPVQRKNKGANNAEKQ